MKVFIPILTVNSHGDPTIEYTDGAHRFMLAHNVYHKTLYDDIRFVHPVDGIEINASTLEELFALAEKYKAAVTLNFDGTVEIEFIGD